MDDWKNSALISYPGGNAKIGSKPVVSCHFSRGVRDWHGKKLSGKGRMEARVRIELIMMLKTMEILLKSISASDENLNIRWGLAQI